MANNGRKRQSQPTSSSKNKILRTESPSFEEEVNALLLASDQSDSEGNIEEFLVSDHEFLQLHESDPDEDLGENIPANYGSNDGIIQDEVSTDSSDEDAPLSELRRSNFYYRKNRCKYKYNMHQPKITDRGDFLKSLARSLVLPQMQRRVVCSQLPRELRLVLKRVLGDDMIEEDVQNPGKRRACSICPPKLHRMSTYTCVGCDNPICLKCSRPLCKNCQ